MRYRLTTYDCKIILNADNPQHMKLMSETGLFPNINTTWLKGRRTRQEIRKKIIRQILQDKVDQIRIIYFEGTPFKISHLSPLKVAAFLGAARFYGARQITVCLKDHIATYVWDGPEGPTQNTS